MHNEEQHAVMKFLWAEAIRSVKIHLRLSGQFFVWFPTVAINICISAMLVSTQPCTPDHGFRLRKLQ
jgi:hypothetical protein